jgi:hypothetical protein
MILLKLGVLKNFEFFFGNCQVSQNLTKQEEEEEADVEGTYNFVCGRENTDDGGFFLSFFQMAVLTRGGGGGGDNR